jgi:hypothetical protein
MLVYSGAVGTRAQFLKPRPPCTNSRDHMLNPLFTKYAVCNVPLGHGSVMNDTLNFERCSFHNFCISTLRPILSRSSPIDMFSINNVIFLVWENFPNILLPWACFQNILPIYVILYALNGGNSLSICSDVRTVRHAYVSFGTLLQIVRN